MKRGDDWEKWEDLIQIIWIVLVVVYGGVVLFCGFEVFSEIVNVVFILLIGGIGYVNVHRFMYDRRENRKK